jgi:DNA-binding Xre family transcriptional regulator
MAKKPALTRFKESLTAEQRALLKQSGTEADRERPAGLAMLRQFEQNMAPVNAEIRNAFQLLMGLRATQRVTMAELSQRTGIEKSVLSRLENDPAAVLSIDMLSSIARAVGAEVRISIGSRAAKPVRARKAVTA